MQLTSSLRTFGIFVVTLCASCTRGTETSDPIDAIPARQQRVIRRAELDWRWPLTVGTGTLGCVSGAVVFRSGGVNYAVNDQAQRRGFASIEPLRIAQPSGPPQNPLKGLPQDVRMRIFAESRACDRSSGSNSGAAQACRQRIRARDGLTEADLKQVEMEGEDRVWPPLVRANASLEPLALAGSKLCEG